MSEDIGREACMWTMTPSSNPGYNVRDRERLIDGVDVIDGVSVPVRRKEKFPQIGHLGDYEDRKPAYGIRYITVVRQDGHEAFVVLTNAAAHLDHTTPYGQYVMMKGRHLGWFQTHHCPAALVQAGALDPDTLKERSIATDAPCVRGTYDAKNPCKHAVAEKAKRQLLHAREMASKDAQSKSLDERRTASQEDATKHFAESLRVQQEANELLRNQLTQQGAALAAVMAKLGEGKSK